MGDEQTLSADEQLQLAREQFETGQDLTLSAEEEFALLDPGTHDMVNRFEDIQAATAGTELGENLAGELIASEVEIKTGRCESFAEAAGKLAQRRLQLIEVVDRLAGGLLVKDPDGVIIGAVGVTGDTSDNDEVCGLVGVAAAGLTPETG